MGIQLLQSQFTDKSDVAVLLTDGWVVSGTIDTKAGNDTITGIGGNDSGGYNGYGIFLLGISTLTTGDGNDNVTGTGGNGSGGAGDGHGGEGIFIFVDEGTYTTGTGNDNVTGTGTGGNGSGGYRGYGGDGIFLLSISTLTTGDGNDNVTGIGGTGSTNNGYGIYNNGMITTGAGADIVNALNGGFGGNGTTDLGAGNDTLKGFGSGNFVGGDGTDKILFGAGIYTIQGRIINGIMNVLQFESIGGVNGGLFAFGDGTLTVGSNGVATFA